MSVGGVAMAFYTSWRLSMLACTTVGPIMHVTQAYAQWSREQAAHTEGRSSQSSAHRDYGRKLLQGVAELKRRLPDDRTPPAS